MAKMAASEQMIWELASHNRRLRSDYEDLKRVLAVLLRREESGQAVITGQELLELPPVALQAAHQPDGGLRLWATQ